MLFVNKSVILRVKDSNFIRDFAECFLSSGRFRCVTFRTFLIAVFHCAIAPAVKLYRLMGDTFRLTSDLTEQSYYKTAMTATRP